MSGANRKRFEKTKVLNLISGNCRIKLNEPVSELCQTKFATRLQGKHKFIGGLRNCNLGDVDSGGKPNCAPLRGKG